jgi:predicted ATPase
VSSELIFRRGSPPEATYTFKHGLVQDAAYGTLLKSRRQQLHARIRQVLEERFPDQVEVQPELLPHHCTQAGTVDRAVDYWYKAGRQAVARSAMIEAVAQLTQGLDLMPGLPAGPDRDRKELSLRLALGNALVAAQGAGAPETAQAYARAAELGELTGDTSHLVAALYGLIRFHFSRAELTSALGVAERALAAAGQGNDVLAQSGGHFAVGWVNLALGYLHPARAHLEHAIGLLDSRPGTPLF